MSVTNGQSLDQATFNNAFVSKTTDSSVAANIQLDDSGDATQGSAITQAQREFNSLNSFLGKSINTAKDVLPSWTNSTVGASTDTVKQRGDTLDLEASRVRTTTGTAIGDTNLGTFTGTTISDNVSIKTALQSLETAVEGVSSGGVKVFRSVTTTDSPTSTDDVLVCSGSSFTINLFTAVGNAGKVLTIVHYGTSLSQIYTIDPSGAELIGAFSTVTLDTSEQVLQIISDGTNWIILDSKTETEWAAYTPTFTGWGTASSVNFLWRRIGTTMQIKGEFTSGTTTATEARLSTPNSLNVSGDGITANIEVGSLNAAAAAAVTRYVVATDGQAYVKFAIQSATQGGLTPRLGTDFTSSLRYYVKAEFSISGWLK